MEGMIICKSCGMPMCRPEDFGTNADGTPNNDYCVHCCKDGKLTAFCQSCGMPMRRPEDFGTNADGTPNDDYCAYCYKDGQFTSDATMDEIIEINLQYLDEINKEFGTQLTPDEARAQMREFFPHLKRWKKC